MINITIFLEQDAIKGFEISGHSTSNADDFDGKLICAAVSSAALMAANTITEIIGDNSDIIVDDGYLQVLVNNTDCCKTILSGLKLHLMELENEYPDKIKVIMEVEP